MVAQEFINYISKFQVVNYVGIEDFADKFNFLLTTIVFSICATIVSVKLYVLKPITCYLSVDSSGTNLLNYVENYCWIQGTIPIKYDGRIPETDAEWDELQKRKILYYQWVPFVLSLQCIMFYIPRIMWQMFCYNKTGTDIQHLVTSANQAVHSSEEARHKMVLHLARSLEQLLFQHRDNRSGKLANFRRKLYKSCNFLVISKRLGNWLVFSYFVLKIVYLSNAIGQIILMQHFLGMDSDRSFFGIEVARNILRGQDWQTTLIFPRVGYCYIKLHHLGIKNAVVAQCVLPVNMLNERIYMFLWYWVVVVIIITAFSIPTWFVRIILQKSRHGFVRKYLKLGEEESDKQLKRYKQMLQKFEQEFLRQDGHFLLQMICLNAGDIITAEIVCQLWRIFKMKYANRNLNDDSVERKEKSKACVIKMEDIVKNVFLKQSSTPCAPVMRDIEEENDVEISVDEKSLHKPLDMSANIKFFRDAQSS